MHIRSEMEDILAENSKLCPMCKEVKLFFEFLIRKYSNGKSIISSWCRICDLAYHAEHKKKTRLKLKQKIIELEPENVENNNNNEIIIENRKDPVELTDTLIENNTTNTVTEHDQKRELQLKKARERYHKNREENIANNRRYKEENKEKIKIQRAEYFQKNKELIRIQRKDYFRNYYLNNKAKIHEYIRKYRSDNPEVKIRNNLNSRLLDYIYKGKHTEDYLGSPIIQVKSWIESNFEIGMTWNNYGTVWQIDHTLPISLFNCSDDMDIFVCFNWKNLYPMFSDENKQKNSKIMKDLIKIRKDRLENFCMGKNILGEYKEYMNLYDEYIGKFLKTV